ncbi:tetratricopeptide repeat protein [Propionicicella superfundia]|uniref:tetratricopeptide repeat protein n=1 Tax=Propionicicella superfundia TaxID=348582 RepID=UPI00041768FD|nr:tetratricopeptide repeat protein [Propionicicella superfundia]
MPQDFGRSPHSPGSPAERAQVAIAALAALSDGRQDGPLALANTLRQIESLISEYGHDSLPATRLTVARLRLRRGTALARLREVDAALEEFERLDGALGASSDPLLREVAAEASIARADQLRAVGRRDEALAALHGFTARYADAVQPHTQRLHAQGQLDLVRWLNESRNPGDGPAGNRPVVDACDALVAAHGRSDDGFEAGCVVLALRVKAAALREQADWAGTGDDSGAAALLEQADALAGEAWLRYADVDDELAEAELLDLMVDRVETQSSSEWILEETERLLRRFGDVDNPELRAGIARTLLLRAETQRALGDVDEALVTLNRLVSSYLESDDVMACQVAVQGVLERGDLLWQQGREDEALPDLLSVVRVFQNEGRASVDETVRLRAAEALTMTANMLAERLPCDPVAGGTRSVSWSVHNAPTGGFSDGSDDEAYALVVNTLVWLFASDRSRPIRRLVSGALDDLGRYQLSRGHIDAGVATCRRLAGLFVDDTDPEIACDVVAALLESGRALAACGRHQEALALYDLALGRPGVDHELTLGEILTETRSARLICKRQLTVEDGEAGDAAPPGEPVGSARGTVTEELRRAEGLQAEGDLRGSSTVYSRVIASCVAAGHPLPRCRCPYAMVRKAQNLDAQGDREAALACVEEALELQDGGRSMGTEHDIAHALRLKAILLDRLGRHEEELDVYAESVARWAASTDSELREIAASAMWAEGTALADQNRLALAAVTYRSAARRYLADAKPAIRLHGVEAALGLAELEQTQGRPGAAIEWYRAAIEAAAGQKAPDVREAGVRARVGLARAYAREGRSRLAAEQFSAALRASRYDVSERTRNGLKGELRDARSAAGGALSRLRRRLADLRRG